VADRRRAQWCLSDGLPHRRRIRFAPIPGGDITWARATVETRRGAASIEWKRTGRGKRGLALDLVVPPGATAVLELPGRQPMELPSGHRIIRMSAF